MKDNLQQNQSRREGDGTGAKRQAMQTRRQELNLKGELQASALAMIDFCRAKEANATNTVVRQRDRSRELFQRGGWKQKGITDSRHRAPDPVPARMDLFHQEDQGSIVPRAAEEATTASQRGPISAESGSCRSRPRESATSPSSNGLQVDSWRSSSTSGT